MDPVVCADVPSWWQVSVLPGASRAFNFSIMAEHLMGTHWYHAHKHGSVSLQVIGGLAGLIIMQPSNDYLAALPVDLAALCTFQKLTDCSSSLQGDLFVLVVIVSPAAVGVVSPTASVCVYRVHAISQFA